MDGSARDEGDNSGVTVFFPRVIHHEESELWFVRLLSVVAGVLLLVGCANLAGLLIARGSARVREFAIRTSLGASSSRLVRQLLTESVLLAVVGGGLGVLLSLGMTGLLNSTFYSVDSEGHPLYFDFSLEPSVVCAALAVSVVAGALFGLLPALKAVRLGAAESLKRESSAVSSRSRLAHWLVGAQAAIAVALVVVAMLLSASARTVVNGANFEASHVALLRLRPRLIRTDDRGRSIPRGASRSGSNHSGAGTRCLAPACTHTTTRANWPHGRWWPEGVG